ncbi:MAG: 26 kDa periplasmic immunogenic protein [Candidatus Erwinia impunctatus]|nr:26 kDa periplasmic immunogenic protein [Culicoides impunctatus]
MKVKQLMSACVLLTGSIACATQAEGLPDSPYIVTAGEASIEVVPDVVTLYIDVNVSAKTAVEAKKEVDQRVAAYYAFLKKNNITEKQVSAANLSTQAEYDYSKTGKATAKGYRAFRQLQVNITTLDTINELLDGALASGLNDIRSIEPGVISPEQYQAKVRQEAINNAIDQAKAMASGFNTQLGPVYSIRYHTDGAMPMPQLRAMAMSADSSKQYVERSYELQTVRFNDRVDVVFELRHPAP